ncbi:glycosyltransferase family 2 protein, partial [Burkholderia sp. SIMBA_024]
ALIREAGGFRKGFEGSQDYDLTLRCVEIAGHDKVVHIPHVLYHWRIAPGSTAGSGSEKPYALLAAIRALQEHLKRIGA